MTVAQRRAAWQSYFPWGINPPDISWHATPPSSWTITASWPYQDQGPPLQLPHQLIEPWRSCESPPTAVSSMQSKTPETSVTSVASHKDLGLVSARDRWDGVGSSIRSMRLQYLCDHFERRLHRPIWWRWPRLWRRKQPFQPTVSPVRGSESKVVRWSTDNVENLAPVPGWQLCLPLRDFPDLAVELHPVLWLGRLRVSDGKFFNLVVILLWVT